MKKSIGIVGGLLALIVIAVIVRDAYLGWNDPAFQGSKTAATKTQFDDSQSSDLQTAPSDPLLSADVDDAKDKCFAAAKAGDEMNIISVCRAAQRFQLAQYAHEKDHGVQQRYVPLLIIQAGVLMEAYTSQHDDSHAANQAKFILRFNGDSSDGRIANSKDYGLLKRLRDKSVADATRLLQAPQN